MGLADTVGYADPGQVRRLFDRALRAVGDRLTCAPLSRYTRSRARQHTRRARSSGIRRFDASTAGIGGCRARAPAEMRPPRTWVFMLTRMGYDTGIDLDRLLALRQQIAGWLQGEQLGGAIWRAGVPKASSKQRRMTHPRRHSRVMRTELPSHPRRAVPALRQLRNPRQSA